MSCWTQLKATTAARNQEDLDSKATDCPSLYKCWEAVEPFAGGSVPWRGTLAEREAADAADAARKAQEPPCVWARCYDACPQFSCSGHFDREKYRPTCHEITQPPKKTTQHWCWEPEANIRPNCEKCLPSPYECPDPEPPDKPCPAEPLRHMPLFLWPDGYTVPNIREVPYPFYKEGLEWKDPPPNRTLPLKDVSLWSLSCTSSVEGPPAEAVEETAEAARARAQRCPGRGKEPAPFFLWHDGYCKPNDTCLPYPGRGFRPFDFCEYLYGRPCYPSKKAIQKEREKRWRESDYCCRATYRQPEWCAALSNISHITPS